MKQLKDILYKVHIEAVHGATDVVVQKLNSIREKIELNDVFRSHQREHFLMVMIILKKALSLGANSW